MGPRLTDTVIGTSQIFFEAGLWKPIRGVSLAGQVEEKVVCGDKISRVPFDHSGTINQVVFVRGHFDHACVGPVTWTPRWSAPPRLSHI